MEDPKIIKVTDSRRRVTLPGDRDLYLVTVHPNGTIVFDPAVVKKLEG
jgi:hypothetical protein